MKADKAKWPKEANTKKDNKVQSLDKEPIIQEIFKKDQERENMESDKPLNIKHLKSKDKLHSKEHFKGKEFFQAKAEFKQQLLMFKAKDYKGKEFKDKQFKDKDCKVKDCKDKDCKDREYKDKEFKVKD